MQGVVNYESERAALNAVTAVMIAGSVSENFVDELRLLLARCQGLVFTVELNINQLPNEILSYIFDMLEIYKPIIRCTCSTWRDIIGAKCKFTFSMIKACNNESIIPWAITCGLPKQSLTYIDISGYLNKNNEKTLVGLMICRYVSKNFGRSEISSLFALAVYRDCLHMCKHLRSEYSPRIIKTHLKHAESIDMFIWLDTTSGFKFHGQQIISKWTVNNIEILDYGKKHRIIY